MTLAELEQAKAESLKEIAAALIVIAALKTKKRP